MQGQCDWETPRPDGEKEGVWLVAVEQSDEHLVGTKVGVMKRRCIAGAADNFDPTLLRRSACTLGSHPPGTPVSRPPPPTHTKEHKMEEQKMMKHHWYHRRMQKGTVGKRSDFETLCAGRNESTVGSATRTYST